MFALGWTTGVISMGILVVSAAIAAKRGKR